MLNISNNQPVTHPQIVSTLSRLCQEWQEATAGVSLLETNGNIGLILADLINGFGLNTEDQSRILGAKLSQELRDFLNATKN
jgi:hypothetical protein